MLMGAVEQNESPVCPSLRPNVTVQGWAKQIVENTASVFGLNSNSQLYLYLALTANRLIYLTFIFNENKPGKPTIAKKKKKVANHV